MLDLPVAAARHAPRAPAIAGTNTLTNTGGQPVSLATLLQLAQQRRG